MKTISPITLNDTNVTTNVPETDYPEWAIGTTYAVGYTVQISSEHGTWENQVADNIGNDPMTTDDRVSDDPKWLYLGKTNPWKMFDDVFVNDQTQTADEIVVQIVPGDVVDGLGVFEVDGQSVTAVVTDPIDGEVYNNTKSLLDIEVEDFYEYFFSPVRSIRSAVFLDLPPYPDATIKVRITDTGGTAKGGAVVAGTSIDIGKLRWGPSIGRISNSKRNKDDYGRVTLVPRKGARRIDLDLIIKNDSVVYSEYQLGLLDGIGAAFIGDDKDIGFEFLNIYGFFNDFRVVVPGLKISECAIEIEGFI